jgi:hypothetical protein
MNNTASQSKECSFDERLETRKFMRDEVFMLTLMAVVSRGHVYKAKPTEREAKKFQSCLWEQLKGMEEKYVQRVDDEAHVGNIESLANEVSASCGEILSKSRFRIGSAQKALNLFLKYLWCLGEIPQPPPHCPFDRRIIECLPEGAQCNWTECDDIEHYKRWVAEARKIAETQSLSLAGWELLTYNEGTA